mmetsp:Transcript_78020/g.135249  ORF Transcript_78020/g.135249 Transcript_78020/m.135249 type:complete len:286 (+) Transcript_78020:102-959(+)
MARDALAALALALCLVAGTALNAGFGADAKSARGSNMLRKSLRTAGQSFIHSMRFKHRLRVCNAYPYSGALDIYRGQEKLTGSPMPYKTCQEFDPNLQSGDRLDFKMGDAGAGAFSVSDLPANDAVLVLVIYRHDTLSTAVSFESHVFANLMNAQIAVIDSYKGPAQAVLRIQDVQDAKTLRDEELRYDSVVAVNPGMYQVVLEGAEDGKAKHKKALVALNRESYVVVRCGVQAEQGASYPEELIVFPKSDPAMLTGAAFAQPRPLIGSLFLAGLTAVFALAQME